MFRDDEVPFDVAARLLSLRYSGPKDLPDDFVTTMMERWKLIAALPEESDHYTLTLQGLELLQRLFGL